MALEPEDRYPTCRALADDIERWMADEPVSAFPEPWTQRFRRWTRRNRTVVSTAAAAAIVALVGLGTVAAVQTRANGQLSAKNLELTAANQARARALDKADARVGLALGALERFRETVAANLDVQNRPENAALRDDLLQTPLAFFRTLRDDLRGDPEARPEDRLKLADAQLELARLTRDVGNQDSALEAAGEAAATLEALGGPGTPGEQQKRARLRLLDALELRARLQIDNGKRDEASKTLERGEQLGEQLLTEAPAAENRLGFARLLALRASSEAETAKIDAALATLARAQPILDAASAHADGGPAVARLQAQLLDQTADVQFHAGKHKEAIESLRAAVSLLEPLIQRSAADWESRELLSDAHYQIAENRNSLAQRPEELEELNKAIEIRRAMARERPANVANRLRLVTYLQSSPEHVPNWVSARRPWRPLTRPARCSKRRAMTIRGTRGSCIVWPICLTVLARRCIPSVASRKPWRRSSNARALSRSLSSSSRRCPSIGEIWLATSTTSESSDTPWVGASPLWRPRIRPCRSAAS